MNNWLKGLLSAIIGGAANSITAVIVDPKVFNLDEGLGKLASMAGGGALLAAAMYLKQSPLPGKDDPPSLLGKSGRSRLVALVAMLWLCIAGVCISIGISGCIKPVMKQDVAERIAVSLSAKALGQNMQGQFVWSPQIDAFVSVIEADGITLSSGQMATNYIMPNIPALYQREARIVFESVGFEFNGAEVVSVSRVDKGLLLEAIGAFKEGLAYK